jgi:hypothetical protein
MKFFLNARFYWKNIRQDDETMGKTAQNLGSCSSWQEIRAFGRQKAVDNHAKRPLKRAFLEMREVENDARRHTHPLPAIQPRPVARVFLRALERRRDAPLNARECRL